MVLFTVGRRTVLGGLAGLAAGGRCAVGPGAPTGLPALPSIRLADFGKFASGIDGVEGVAVAYDGALFISDARSALTIIDPMGRVRHIGRHMAQTGVAIDAEGRAIVANVGLLNGRPGPLQRIDPRNGTVDTIAATVEGRTLVASNFPTVAPDGTIYCTHSAWDTIVNIGRTEPTGFVFSVSPQGAVRIAADGLRGPNGCCLDAVGRHLYVALTPEGRIVRYPRRPDGSLGARENYGPVLGEVIADQHLQPILAMPRERRNTLGYVDGIAFDRVGNLWVTLPFSNRLVAITPAGGRVEMVHDPDAAIIDMPTNLAWSRDGGELFLACRGSGSILRAPVIFPA